MPWNINDAIHHTHKATTLKLKRLWVKVANKERKKRGDKRAIKIANAAVRGAKKRVV
ncbi:MAG: hypothetical protein KGJ13_05340 [Patescibacteria group bacterium]|nr:hypothetical protein [Patescibacteria group bacterium]